jgi:hypothetical protein
MATSAAIRRTMAPHSRFLNNLGIHIKPKIIKITAVGEMGHH